MKVSTALVLTVFVVGLGFGQIARADNTKFKITVPSDLVPLVSSKGPCKGQGVKVVNQSGITRQFIVKDGAGNIIINETIVHLGTSVTPASFSTPGIPVIIIDALPEKPLPPLDAEFCDFVPTLSEWSVVAMVLLLLAAGTVVFGRRRGLSPGPV